ncbi:oxidoreductase [Apiospora arundinis]
MSSLMGRSGACCMALSALFGDQVAFPLSQAYNASLASYFSPQQSAISPLCIVSPATVGDVSATLRTLTAPTDGCHFALRSGGHSTLVGASNIDAGVAVDLRRLNGIQLSPDRQTVRVGTGATWGVVSSYLEPLNLAVAGAREPSVGVGGLTIGGGISWLGPRYGWTCDTVVNFEVVTANGTVINANRQENPDLRWGLCGGGNSFGVVTRVDLRAFAQEGGQVWGGVAYYNVSNAEEEILALADFSKPGTYDEYSSLIATFAYTGGAPTIINSMVYTKPEKDPPAFRALSAIPSLQSNTHITNMTSLLALTASMTAPGLRSQWATLTIIPTAAALRAAVQAWNASLASVQGTEDLTWALVTEPLPPGFYAQHAADNALGLGGRKGRALMIILFNVTWRQLSDDGKIDAALKAWVESTTRLVGALGALDPYLHLNYAAAWQRNPIASYGEDSVRRLARVQREYDSRGVFTKLSPGGFKLPASASEKGQR